MESKTVIRALAALAQENRLGIFRLLVQAGPTGMAAGEIGAELKIAPATLSFHLKELSYADLIAARQDGRFIFYSANFEQMGALVAFLTENCCGRDGVICAPGLDCGPSQATAKTRRKGVKA
jgi:ArsR family transcriptional regulator, arsenate/arsenite/antimonite-responsive transcriptional repressor